MHEQVEIEATFIDDFKSLGSSVPAVMNNLVLVYLESPADISSFVRLLQANFASPNSKNLCLVCWCLCNRYQQAHHKHAGHQTLTPRFFKDWPSYISIADQCGKYRSTPASEKRVYEVFHKH